MPTFNIKGKDRVNTLVGGVLSLIIYMVIFMYSTLKFSYLVTKDGPNISSYDQEDGMNGRLVNLS